MEGETFELSSRQEMEELRNKLAMIKVPWGDEVLTTYRRQVRALRAQRQANATVRGEINAYESELKHLESQQLKFETSDKLNELRAESKSLAGRLSMVQGDYQAENMKRRRLEEEVSRARSRLGGLFTQAEGAAVRAGRVRTEENRLGHVLVNFNQNLDRLAALRSQIDELRKDRGIFTRRMLAARAERDAKDKEIRRLVAESNEAYTRRDERMMQYQQLTQQERQTEEEHEEARQRMADRRAAERIAKSRPPPQRERVSPTASQIGSEGGPVQEDAGPEQVGEQLTTLLKVVGFKDEDEMIASSEALDRDSFTAYSFVQENERLLSELTERLEIARRDLDEAGRRIHEEAVEDGNELGRQHRELGERQRDLDGAKNSLVEHRQDFAQIAEALEELFNTCECDWSGAPDEERKVTIVNVLYCFEQLETKLGDLVKTVYEKARVEFVTGKEPPLETREDTRTSQSPFTQTSWVRTTEAYRPMERPLTLEEIEQVINP